MKINERGFWENETAEGHGHDESLAKAIVEFFEEEEETNDYPILFIYDVGCGDGYYTRFINNNGERKLMCWGFDGNPHTQTITKDWNCSVIDFTEPITLVQIDWILCLEVGEHIPEEYEDIL